MVPAAATQIFPIALAWFLLVLLGGRCLALRADIHSLCLNFTVKGEPVPRQLWSEVQCSVNGVPFLQYSDNKAKPLGALGKKVNATEVWKDLIKRLKYMGEEFEKKLLNRQLRTVKFRGCPPLQAKMLCRHEQGQLIDAYWLFTISGQYSFLFYPMNLTWILINPEAKDTMQKCKDDKELVDDLGKISMGDCPHWLKDLLKHHKETPGPTSKFPSTPQLLSTTELPSMISLPSTTWLPSTTQLPSTPWLSSTEISAIVVACLLPVLVILAFVKRSSIMKGNSRCYSSTSSSVLWSHHHHQLCLETL